MPKPCNKGIQDHSLLSAPSLVIRGYKTTLKFSMLQALHKGTHGHMQGPHTCWVTHARSHAESHVGSHTCMVTCCVTSGSRPLLLYQVLKFGSINMNLIVKGVSLYNESLCVCVVLSNVYMASAMWSVHVGCVA